MRFIHLHTHSYSHTLLITGQTEQNYNITFEIINEYTQIAVVLQYFVKHIQKTDLPHT